MKKCVEGDHSAFMKRLAKDSNWIAIEKDPNWITIAKAPID
jgi:hypothetical protein